ncbi:uncharacterized protein LOC144282319 [Canis aureus]
MKSEHVKKKMPGRYLSGNVKQTKGRKQALCLFFPSPFTKLPSVRTQDLLQCCLQVRAWKLEGTLAAPRDMTMCTAQLLWGRTTSHKVKKKLIQEGRLPRRQHSGPVSISRPSGFGYRSEVDQIRVLTEPKG